jgi:hypothetical protein
VAQTRFSLMTLTRVRWRLSLTLLCLFASTFQSSLAQTHVHNAAGADESFVARAISSADSQAHVTDQTAPTQSQNHSGTRENGVCPLCQILLFGGGLPTAPYEVPSRPLAAHAHDLLEQVPACFISAVSYDWQSRGPPRI